jgi:hypothetical protein
MPRLADVRRAHRVLSASSTEAIRRLVLRHRTLGVLAGMSFALSLVPVVARAQSTPAEPAAPTGAPPPEAKALVEAPKTANAEPDLAKPADGMAASLSAGGQLATGNSRLLAGTVNGSFDTRFHDNGVGVSVLGNYGQGAPPGLTIVETSENIQGRVRYDRYVIDQASLFLIFTGRHDRFQGLDFRMNIDPGFKYMLRRASDGALWAEAGYDFQYDIRRTDALEVRDGMGNPVLDANGHPELLSRTATDHSARLFLGFRHAFNKEVTLGAGLEYLQSVVDATRYRVNFDALFAAKVAGGLALGLGFLARYDHAPLPGKENLDTATTISLIYSYSETAAAPASTAPASTAPAPASTLAPSPASKAPASAAPASPAPAPASTPPASTPAPNP